MQQIWMLKIIINVELNKTDFIAENLEWNLQWNIHLFTCIYL